MHDKRHTMRRHFVRLLSPLLLLPFFAQAAHAQTVYVAGDGNEFGTLNVATGTFQQRGTLASTLFGMGFTSDGTLYGVDSQSQLYRVNPANGAEAYVGAVSPNSVFTATATGPLLYGLTGDASGVFFSIDPATQTETVLNSSTGITSDGLFASGAGALFATSMTDPGDSELYQLSSSGTAIDVGSTGITDSTATFGAGVFVGSTLYGFNSNGGIYTFNLNTGLATRTTTYALGASDDTLYAAAIAPAAAPEPSQAAALAIGIFGLTLLRLKAKKRQTRVE